MKILWTGVLTEDAFISKIMSFHRSTHVLTKEYETLLKVCACPFVDIAMAIARVDGRFLECNRKFEKLTGYTRDELLESNMFALTHKQDLPKMFACIRGMLSKKYTLCKSVKKWVRKDGNLFPCSCVISVVANKNDGMPKYFVCFGPSTLHSDDSDLEDGQSSSSTTTASNVVSPALSSASTGSIASSINSVIKTNHSPRASMSSTNNNNMQIDHFPSESSSRSSSPRPTSSSLGGDRRRMPPPPPPSHAPPPLSGPTSSSSSTSSNGLPPRINIPSNSQHSRGNMNMAVASRMVTNGMHTLSLSNSSGVPGSRGGHAHHTPPPDVKHTPTSMPRVQSYPGSSFPQSQPQYTPPQHQQQQQQQQQQHRIPHHRGSFSQSQVNSPSVPQQHFQMSMHAARMVARQAAAVTKPQHHSHSGHSGATRPAAYQSRPPPPPNHMNQLTPHTRLNPATTFPRSASSSGSGSSNSSAPPPPPSPAIKQQAPLSPNFTQQRHPQPVPGAPNVTVKSEPPPVGPSS